MIRRFIDWCVGLFRDHDCSKHGHKYFARYDEMIDPRLTNDQVESMWRAEISVYLPRLRNSLLTKIYVKDICSHCGDVIERIEGMNAMEVLAHAANRIA